MLTLEVIRPDGSTWQHVLARGHAGTEQTLHAMRAVVIDALRYGPEIPGMRTIDVLELWQWAKRRVIFRRDELGRETLQHPIIMLRTIKATGNVQGDCDDRSMLLAAIIKHAGARVALVAMNVQPGPFVHVLPALIHEGRLFPMDTQEAGAFGAWPLPPHQLLTVEV
jgi:hypothetical protein